MLIDAGVDINNCNDKDNTPSLHFVTFSNYFADKKGHLN